MIRSVLCLTFCVLVVMLLNQKDAHANDIQLICQEKQKIGFFYSSKEKQCKPTLMDTSEFSFVLRKPQSKDKKSLDTFKDILPPAPHAFIAVTTDVGAIYNACPTPPNSGGYMKCVGSGELEVNINTGRFTKYSSDVMYLFAWEENKDFDIIEPVSVTLGDCRKLF